MLAALTHHEITVMLLSLGILLALARTLGEIAQWLQQPAVVGEILAGILLGPTVLGMLAPEWNRALFPTQGALADVLSGLTTVAVTLFLLVAGMEVDLSTVWRQGPNSLKLSVCGMVVPFLVGFVVAWFAPQSIGVHADADPLIFALFFATALSISALPVIAKTLMDLNLYRSDFGMVIVSAAIVDDVTGWIIFAIVLGMIGSAGGPPNHIGLTIACTLLFAIVMLTVVRWLIHRMLPYIQAYTHWPGGVLSFALTLALFSAALTEWIGIHAIFGAFLAGVAIGDSSHLRERTRATIENFVSFIFAPLFFASIGLRINITSHFDLPIILAVLIIACAGKLSGCWLGGKWAGMPPRDRWAIAFGMNARGAMEIILGLLAWEAGVIRQRLFVALVIMALVTSMMAGPMLQWCLGRRKPRSVRDLLSARTFLPALEGTSRHEVIHELVQAACASAPALECAATEAAVLAREETMHTGIGNGVALPHARLPNLAGPVVAMGLSPAGVDFDAPDGVPAYVVFLILTPVDDDGEQLAIMASLAQVFRGPANVEKVRTAKSYTELLAVLKSATLQREEES